MKVNSPKILLTGGHGQLAQSLVNHPLAQNFNIISYSHAQLDISNKSAIDKALTQIMPHYVINTAAYTAVDQAEEDQRTAFNANVLGPKNLGEACERNGIKLCHVSTDYVFDGTSETPLNENALIHPINIYGQTKWLGEEAIRQSCEQHFILRVSGVFSEYGNNFLKTMLRLAQEKKQLSIVSDQITCPTYAGDIADALFAIMQSDLFGTYHYCNKDAVSWHGFAIAIFDVAKKYFSLSVQNINAIESKQYVCAAKRPRYSVLDCNKIYNDFAIQQIHWKNGIQHVIETLFKNRQETQHENI